MSNAVIKKREMERKRKLRTRKKLRGTSMKPRMCVVKTNKHIHVQLIDDETGVTLGAVGTGSKELAKTEFNRRNKSSAKKLGEIIADIAKKKNINEVIFDRGPFKYHGVLAELANAAREKGLVF